MVQSKAVAAPLLFYRSWLASEQGEKLLAAKGCSALGYAGHNSTPTVTEVRIWPRANSSEIYL